MKNWAKFLAFLTLPAIALIGCAHTDEDEPQNHYWQEEEVEHKKHKHEDEDDEREERMEREIYRDK